MYLGKISNIFAISLLYLFFNGASIAFSSVKINKISFPSGNLSISLSTNTSFKIFTLKNPNRLVIDVNDAQLKNPNYKPKLPSFAKSFRTGKNDNSLRIVFDLKEEVKIKNMNLKSNIISAQIIRKETDFISNKVAEFEVQTRKVKNKDGTSKYIVKKIPLKKAKKKKRKPIIVIDAGHGGKDPGAIGRYLRTKEKIITLSYSQELARQLKRTKKYKVYLTRNKDFFIPLRKRVQKARKVKADIFISIHANSARNRKASGFSIYTLSEKSSDKQAERLAKRENRADIISGVNFSGASRDIMKTLIDLSQRESKNKSATFANIAIKSVKRNGIKAIQNTHRFAGFAVLTAPDMASTLIELGYLTNRKEEKLLNSVWYKRKVAKSLAQAIDEYFKKNKL